MEKIAELIEKLKKLRRYRINIRVERTEHVKRDGDISYYLTDDYVKVHDLDLLLKEFK